MYYEPQLKNFNESEKGLLCIKLKKINSSLGYLVSLLDNFYDYKIKICEFIKDIDNIVNDIQNDSNLFDIRRKMLFDSWIKDFDIKKYLPIGAKQACLALSISYDIDLLLKDLNDDYKEYLYNISLYLKQTFKQINELKGVSVER